MASKKYLLIATAILLILASACVFADRADDERSGTERGAQLRLSGTVSDIDYGSEVFAVKDGNYKYTIIAEGIKVVLRNGAAGQLRDIKKGMMVSVVGERITSSQVAARSLTVIEDTSRFDNARNTGRPDNGRNAGDYNNNDQSQIEGYVTEVNSRAREIHVRANRDDYVVAVTAGTEIRRSGFLTGITGMKKDDHVSISGNPRGKGRIDARYIQILTNDRDNRDDDRNNHRNGTVEGTVSSAASYFDRSIAIRTTYGETKVDVTKDAYVQMDGRSVSIHNVSKGLWVRAYGEWSGNTFTANRLDVYSSNYDDRDRPGGGYRPADPRGNPPTYPQTRVGVITSIDTRKSIIKLDVGITDMTINATNADVTKQGSKISLNRLQKGDKIQVSGDYIADTLRARSIQVLKWAEEMGVNEKW